MDTLNSKLNNELNMGRIKRLSGSFAENNPVVTCVDGYTISIQCQLHNYCEPRKNLTDVKGYYSFELGFPSKLDALINPYAEEQGTTETVFPYVPRSVVVELLRSHGGIVE
tara:strand:+ start:166 stop:498 length:333 start_codon:yes stop_codon:yes gene_type:complete